MLLGIIHILRLFKEGGVGQAKYDNCIPVRRVGAPKIWWIMLLLLELIGNSNQLLHYLLTFKWVITMICDSWTDYIDKLWYKRVNVEAATIMLYFFISKVDFKLGAIHILHYPY